jgi:glutathione synthase/RimK-type ligase-like ATP-grasp enzyme
MKTKPVIVFVFYENTGQKSTRYGGFIKRLQEKGQLKDIIPRAVALSELIISVDKNQKATIKLANGSKPFDDASLVYFKSWEGKREQSAAVASYLGAKGIKVLDSVIADHGVSKLSQLMKRWQMNIPITPFVYSEKPLTEEQIEATVGSGPYVVKAAFGEKGRNNFLVQNAKEAAKLQASAPMMLVQPYIPNDGDWRIMVYGFKVRGGIYRHSAAGSHLNNTSAGGRSEYFATKDIPKDVKRLAVAAAKVSHLAIAGVDVIVDKNTCQTYILEVNQGSQIVTGHYTDKKIAAFNSFLNDVVSERYHKKQSNRLQLIGRHVKIDIPELKIRGINAKIDTGAYRSALHAANILVDGDGVLHFTIKYNDENGRVQTRKVSATNYSKTRVRSSSGMGENRYLINVLAVVEGQEYDMQVSLTNRSGMKYPMLIGRKVLRSNFIVNPELGKKIIKENK